MTKLKGILKIGVGASSELWIVLKQPEIVDVNVMLNKFSPINVKGAISK